MQRLIFESSPAFILLCVLLGLGYAWLLYRSKHAWSKRVNQILFGLRAVVVSLLAFLLVGPILKLINNIYEKPSIVFLIDNSSSITNAVDTVKLQRELEGGKQSLEQRGYEVVWKDLNNKTTNKVNFNNKSSDLNGALRDVVTDFEGKNLTNIVLLTDGIY